MKTCKLSLKDFSIDRLMTCDDFVLTIQPKSLMKATEVTSWALENKNLLSDWIVRHGGILFKGFEFNSLEFAQFCDQVFKTDKPATYQGGIAIRKPLESGLFLASVKPKQITLSQHQELAYHPDYPALIFFFCDEPAEKGGETPICSTRVVMKCMDPKTYEKFKRKRVLYIRNILMEDDPHWGEAGWMQGFENCSREEIETFFRKQHIQCRWKGDVLYTEYIAPSTVIHPVTGEELWSCLLYTSPSPRD